MSSISVGARLEAARAFAGGRLARNLAPDQVLVPGARPTLAVDAAHTWAVPGGV
jgi:hypothetical protein